MKKISKFFKEKVILITGGTGSFGKKFVELLIQETNLSSLKCQKNIIKNL